ncbi:hypothetical protein [Burkholderia gladioli]|uniref:hypothetical protein n=1 Tax=Burkholderia gladioli TaxID=28095 RepID=UPI00164095D1|nr:hypothetical protein [Burkholderia gladioli]
MCDNPKVSGHLKCDVSIDRADLLHAKTTREVIHGETKLPGTITVQVCRHCASFVEYLYPAESFDETVDDVETTRGVIFREDADSYEHALREVAVGAGKGNEVHSVIEFGPYETPEGWLVGMYAVSGWNFTWGDDTGGLPNESRLPTKTREQARKGAELIRAALIAGNI